MAARRYMLTQNSEAGAGRVASARHDLTPSRAAPERRVTFRRMGLAVDPNTLTLTDAPEAPPGGQRPVAGLMIAGYGCYVNAAHIVKVETARSGRDYFVRAFLQATPTAQSDGSGTTVQAGMALLTPPLATEQEAHDACDAICTAMFLVLSTNPNGGGAHWPVPEDGSGAT